MDEMCAKALAEVWQPVHPMHASGCDFVVCQIGGCRRHASQPLPNNEGTCHVV